MKQVLLAPQPAPKKKVNPGDPAPIRTPPILMWLSDDFQLGDTLVWQKQIWIVSTIYTTTFPHSQGTECRHCDRPHRNRSAAVTIDHHGDPTHPGN